MIRTRKKPGPMARYRAKRRRAAMKMAKPIREYVFDREQNICRCCRIRRAESRHELIPRGRGGKITKRNCVAVCGQLIGIDPSCHTYLQNSQIGVEMSAEGAEGQLSFRAQSDDAAEWMRVEKGLWVCSMPGGRNEELETC